MSDPIHQSIINYEKTRKDSIPFEMTGIERTRNVSKWSERPERSQSNKLINTNRTIKKIIDKLRETIKLNQTIKNEVQRIEVKIKVIKS